MEKFDIKNELLKYKAITMNERQAVLETLQFLNENKEDAFDRKNTKGHITGSALVVDKKGNILLNHHKKAGIWIQFGGHSDGENDTQAVALREVREETGIKKLRILNQGIFDCAVYEIPAGRTKGECAHKHYDIDFLVMVEKTNFVVSKESSEIRWCTPLEALELVENDEICTRMILKSQAYFNENSLSPRRKISAKKIYNLLAYNG